MHTVTLSPVQVDLVAGGAPVVQTVTVGNVPDDVSVVNPIEVAVGTVTVSVNTTVTVDHPSPTCTVTSTAPGDFSVSAASPVQTGPGVWTIELTYVA